MSKGLKNLNKLDDIVTDLIYEVSNPYKMPKDYGERELINEIYKELKALDDVEGILGMDLVSVVELCNKVNNQHYVYVQEDWGLSKVEFIDDLDIQLFNHRLYSNSRGIWYSFDLQEHKKNWWLKADKSE